MAFAAFTYQKMPCEIMAAIMRISVVGGGNAGAKVSRINPCLFMPDPRCVCGSANVNFQSFELYKTEFL
jgi:hypothetical protein